MLAGKFPSKTIKNPSGQKLHSKFLCRMNNEWAAIFDGRPKQKLVEDKPYRCVICKADQRHYAKATDYFRHMKGAHKFS